LSVKINKNDYYNAINLYLCFCEHCSKFVKVIRMKKYKNAICCTECESDLVHMPELAKIKKIIEVI